MSRSILEPKRVRKISSTFAFIQHRFIRVDARNSLIDKDLIAFNGHTFQVLSLPEKPVLTDLPSLNTKDDMRRHDPATVRKMIVESFRGASQ